MIMFYEQTELFSKSEVADAFLGKEQKKPTTGQQKYYIQSGNYKGWLPSLLFWLDLGGFMKVYLDNQGHTSGDEKNKNGFQSYLEGMVVGLRKRQAVHLCSVPGCKRHVTRFLASDGYNCFNFSKKMICDNYLCEKNIMPIPSKRLIYFSIPELVQFGCKKKDMDKILEIFKTAYDVSDKDINETWAHQFFFGKPI